MIPTLPEIARALCPLMAAAVLVTAAVVPTAAEAQDLPKGFEQILPRGGIPSIDAPGWVSVAEAEIPDDAWIFGVVIDGQARAFAINVLNRHEIVNDKIGDTAYAAVW